jgi:hypothetical protein
MVMLRMRRYANKRAVRDADRPRLDCMHLRSGSFSSESAWTNFAVCVLFGTPVVCWVRAVIFWKYYSSPILLILAIRAIIDSISAIAVAPDHYTYLDYLGCIVANFIFVICGFELSAQTGIDIWLHLRWDEKFPPSKVEFEFVGNPTIELEQFQTLFLGVEEAPVTTVDVALFGNESTKRYLMNIFPDPNDALMKRHCDELRDHVAKNRIDAISEEVQLAIQLYTYSTSKGVNFGTTDVAQLLYRKLNAVFYTGDLAKGPDVACFMKLLKHGMDKLSTDSCYKREGPLFRGIYYSGKEEFQNHRKQWDNPGQHFRAGRVINFPAWTSTSCKESVARDWGNKEAKASGIGETKWKYKVLYVFKNVVGVSVTKISYLPHEDEVWLPWPFKGVVEKAGEIENGWLRVELTRTDW